jgi:hypothetical protein
MKTVGATLAVARDNTMVAPDDTMVAGDTMIAPDNIMVAGDNRTVTGDGTRAGNHQTHVHDWKGQPQGLPLQFRIVFDDTFNYLNKCLQRLAQFAFVHIAGAAPDNFSLFK